MSWNHRVVAVHPVVGCWINLYRGFKRKTLLCRVQRVPEQSSRVPWIKQPVSRLKTLLRPATGEELFLVFITLTEEGNSFNNKFYKANLRKSNCFKLMRTQLQVLTQPNLTASVKDNMLYVTGVGRYCKEVWRYGDCEWVQCGKLVEGRRGHCQAIVNSCIYICGGNSVKNKNDVLNCIEKIWHERTQIHESWLPVTTCGRLLGLSCLQRISLSFWWKKQRSKKCRLRANVQSFGKHLCCNLKYAWWVSTYEGRTMGEPSYSPGTIQLLHIWVWNEGLDEKNAIEN